MNTPRVFSVPAGTPSSRCGGSTCGALVWWITTPTGRRVPVDCNAPGAKRPSESKERGQFDVFGGEAAVYDGLGPSHAPNCPNADEFR